MSGTALAMNMKSNAANTSAKARQFSDAEIVRGLTNRESSAAIALHQKYGTKINRIVWRALGGDDEHNDVVNEVFSNILKQIGNLCSVDALDSWIVSISFNTVRRELRDRKRRYNWGFRKKNEPQIVKENQETTRCARSVFDLLDKMKAEYRIFFVMRFIEQYTIKEIAKYNSCSISTVHRKLAAAETQFMKRASKDVILKSMVVCDVDNI